MSRPTDPGPQPITRRQALRRGRAALTLAAAHSLAPFALSGCGLNAPEPEVKLGLLHSQTGTMAISETSLRDAELMAIEEINRGGGVLGHRIVPVVENPRSRSTDLFPKQARKLLEVDRVAAVFGCWTSVSRKALIPVIEELNGLLFYPVQYEGNESSRNVIYGGSTPNQQILPAIDWLIGEEGGFCKRFYVLGSDYVFPWTTKLIVAKYLESMSSRGLELAGFRYVPLGHRDFKSLVIEIEKAEPDVVINLINGDSNIHFFNELAAREVVAENIRIVSSSVGEDELRGLLPSAVKGHLSASSYFQTVDRPENKSFVARFQEEHGGDRVLSDPMEAAYSLIYLWKMAAEQAQSFEVDRVREAMTGGIRFEAPGGTAIVDPKTQHMQKRFRLGKARDDRQFQIIYESPEPIAPDPYPAIAFPGWSCDWTRNGVTKGESVEIGSW